MTAKEYQRIYSRKTTLPAQNLPPDQLRQPGAKVLIGIDPGSVVTGFACITDNGPPVLLGFKSHCEAILHVLSVVMVFGNQNVHIVIEDARKAATNGGFAKRNGSKKDQGVGYVKCLSKDWQMFCERVAKVEYTMQAPVPALTKWEPERFEKLTGIKTLKGEHHLRDAFLALYYRHFAEIETIIQKFKN